MSGDSSLVGCLVERLSSRVSTRRPVQPVETLTLRMPANLDLYALALRIATARHRNEQPKSPGG